MKQKDNSRAIRNQEFEKDVKEFDFVITQLISAFYKESYNVVASSKKKGKVQTIINIDKMDFKNLNCYGIPEMGDCYSILKLWNNTVEDYPLELKHLSGFINSNRFQTFILIIKENEFVYSSAIPLGISSIIGATVFAIPDKFNGLSMYILARILFNIALKIFSNFADILNRNSKDLLQLIAAMFAAVKLNIALNRNSFFKKRFNMEHKDVAELMANTVISINDYNEKIKNEYRERLINILFKVIDDYYYYALDDERIIYHLFYENGAMKYIIDSINTNNETNKSSDENKTDDNASESTDDKELQESNE